VLDAQRLYDSPSRTSPLLPTAMAIRCRDLGSQDQRPPILPALL
jgi:hypothetical protein